MSESIYLRVDLKPNTAIVNRHCRLSISERQAEGLVRQAKRVAQAIHELEKLGALVGVDVLEIADELICGLANLRELPPAPETREIAKLVAGLVTEAGVGYVAGAEHLVLTIGGLD